MKLQIIMLTWKYYVFCVRFVDVTNAKPCIKELFVDFLHLQRGTGEAVTNGI